MLSAAAAAATEPGFEPLFDGTSLAGWQANRSPASWRVENGAIVCHGPWSLLFYMGPDPAQPADFTDFHFKAEVMTRPNSNSGVFFHTALESNGLLVRGYETQVNNSFARDPVRTGSLYNVVKVFEAAAKDDVWYTQEVIVQGKQVTVIVEGKRLFEYVEPEGVAGRRTLAHGTFALQAHDPDSEVHFRNIRVQRLP
jgi:hypothetical protein